MAITAAHRLPKASSHHSTVVVIVTEREMKMNTEIRELDVADMDQVSGGMFGIGLNPVGDAFRAVIAAGKIAGNIAGQVVGGSQGAGPAGGGKGGAGPVPA
jgi:hypothetical protein